MGGEGSMMAMINSIKNNKNLLSKRKDKKGLSGSYSGVKLKEFPKATPEELKRIQEKVQLENRLIRNRQLMVFGILLAIIIVLIIKL